MRGVERYDEISHALFPASLLAHVFDLAQFEASRAEVAVARL